MERASFADFTCSLARTLEEVGEWWTLLILRDLFVGMTQFDEIQRNLGVSTNVLTARLKRLTSLNIIARTVSDKDARAFHYSLTPKGKALYPVLLSLLAWGDQWLVKPEGPPLLVVHRLCGHATHAVPHCAVCGEAMALDDVELRTGPGAKAGPGTARMGDYIKTAMDEAAARSLASSATLNGWQFNRDEANER